MDESTTVRLLLRIAQQLESIDRKLSSQATSSVNIKTSTRGNDIDVKLYAGSPIGDVGDQAVDEYFRIAQLIEDRLMARTAA